MQVMDRAIRLARDGFVLERGDIDSLTGSGGYGDLDALTGPSKRFARQPNIAAIFLNDGKPYQVGDRLVQTNLARTLELIEKEGADAFYKGRIADAIVRASNAHGGILTKAAFAAYYVEQNRPIECSDEGYTVILEPPPSSTRKNDA